MIPKVMAMGRNAHIQARLQMIFGLLKDLAAPDTEAVNIDAQDVRTLSGRDLIAVMLQNDTRDDRYFNYRISILENAIKYTSRKLSSRWSLLLSSHKEHEALEVKLLQLRESLARVTKEHDAAQDRQFIDSAGHELTFKMNLRDHGEFIAITGKGLAQLEMLKASKLFK